MRVFITGEGGLLAHAISKVVPVVTDDMYKSYPSKIHKRPEVDVRNMLELRLAIGKLQPDVIIHSAAVVNTDKCASDPKDCIESNVLGTQNVVDVCKDMGIKLMYFSTTATYDPKAYKPYNEDSPQNPPTLYGITKLAGEMIVRNSGIPHTIIRPCFIYGYPPYDHSSQICKIAMRMALNNWWSTSGEDPKVTLDPSKIKDYMWVEDFAEAIRVCIEKIPFEGRIYNISRHDEHKMEDYFLGMANRLGYIAPPMEWVPETDYMGDHLVSSRLFREDTGWEPMVLFGEGLNRLSSEVETYVKDCLYEGKELEYR